MNELVYSEELKKRRNVYICYPCNRRTVRYRGGKWVCVKCGMIHSMVQKITND